MATEEQEAALEATIHQIRERAAASRLIGKADRVLVHNWPGAHGPEVIQQWITRGRAAAQILIESDKDRLLTLVTLGLQEVERMAHDGEQTQADELILAQRYVEQGGS